MSLATKDYVELFFGIFGRTPEAKELAIFTSGTYATRAALADEMLKILPAASYPNKLTTAGTNADFVEAAYKNFFDRAADAAGKTWWADALDSGAVTRSAFLAEFVEGAAKNTTAQGKLDYLKVEDALSKAIPGYATGGIIDLTVAGSNGLADNLTGTTGYDIFRANIIDNKNTLESGDTLDGGAGKAELRAEIGDSQNFAITAKTTNVDKVTIRTQASANAENADNDLAGDADAYEVQIDAQDMVGVKEWWALDNRADLAIEDVRYNSHETTVGWRNTDPGDVDFGVYFNPCHITKPGVVQTGSTLYLQLMDINSMQAGTGPLQDNPYNGFTFTIDGVTKTIQSQGMIDAKTYTDLIAAINTQIAVLAQTDATFATIQAKAGAPFTATHAGTGVPYQGTVVEIVNSGSGAMGTGGWLTPTGVAPGSGNIAQHQTTETPAPPEALTQVDIVLDNVGRCSKAGDLEIGSMSLGGYSGSKGIQQFNITVEKNSWLDELSSTNNTLEVVNVVNAAGQTGYLRIDNATTGGVQDVRVFDASAMTGAVRLTAALNNTSIAKYLDLKDSATNHASDNKAFDYTGGAGNDSFTVKMAGKLVSHEDFTFKLTGGAGNDTLNTEIDFTGLNFAYATNQQRLKNLTVDAGAGDDVVWTKGAGDFTINAGSGNDTVYTDNSGLGTAAARVNEVQTITFGSAGDLATQGIVTVTLPGGQAYQTVQPQVVTLTKAAASNAGAAAWAIGNIVAVTINGVTANYTLVAGDVAADDAVFTTNLAAFINADPTLSPLVDALGTGNNTLTLTADVATTALAVSIAVTDTDGGGADTFTPATTTAQNTILTNDSATTVATKVAAAINAQDGGVNVVAVPTGDKVVLTYTNAYVDAQTATNGDVGMATVKGIVTDVTMTVADTTASDASTLVAAVTETATITFATAATAGQTLIFTDGATTTTVTLVDTDNNGSVTPFEIAQQVGAATFANWTVTSVNPSIAQITVEAKAAGVIADFAKSAGTAASTATPSAVTQGVNAVAETGVNGEVQTLTITNGADQAGTITLGLDINADGTIAANEYFEIAVAAGNQANVAASVAAGITALTGVTATQGAAGAATANTVAVKFAALGNAATITMVDGGVRSAIVAETTKGRVATDTNAATWVLNSTNKVVADLDGKALLNDAILYNAQLTVTFSGGAYAASGVTNDAAEAFKNGFESKVTIPTINNVGNQYEVNQAIKAAINADAVLSKFLKAEDGPSDTLIITSLVDGKVLNSDLAINISAPTSLTTAELNTLNATYKALTHNSAAADMTEAAMLSHITNNVNALNAIYTTDQKLGTTAGGVELGGNTSTAQSDNVINLGTGNDVMALGSGDLSNDTIVFTGYSNGQNTILNFSDSGTAMDYLDFRSYLTSQTSASGSAVSAITVDRNFSTDTVVTANEVVITDFATLPTGAGVTWANLTEGTLQTALNADGTFTVGNTANLVGATQKAVIMVQNGANDGEYKIFDLTLTNTAGNTGFTVSGLIGTVDLGDSIVGSNALFV